MRQIKNLPLMTKSQILVLIQFSVILLYAVSGPLIAKNIWLEATELIGLALAVWAIFIMNPIRISIFPEPREDGELIETGPYAFIRHPMYTSILIVAAVLTLDRMDIMSVALFLILVINQVVKLKFEEKLLIQKYAGYSEYMKRTKALVPFIF